MADRDEHRRRRRRRAARVLGGIAVAVAVVALGAAGYAYLRLRASRPLLDGTAPVAGLSGSVSVERDALGVPTVRGASRLDVARATGFVHAQDRFFQMDLLRRRAAGELAELFGPLAVEVDRKTRLHRFRAVAARVLATLPPPDRDLLEAYAGGVNAGLAALRDRPFEYLLLRAAPAPWRAEDSVLVIHAMFIDLQGEDDAYESALGALRDAVPQPI
ncbi:MAG: penicillin acylase family protein, partial [Anaeromyxobacteraceae bacterium]